MKLKVYKKTLCILLIAVLMIPVTVNADRMDLAALGDMSEFITIDVDQENGCAFVESKFNPKSRSFVHEFESDARYSTTRFDLLILDYFEITAYPVFRLWIQYAADEFLNINSATFELNGTKYTFTGIADKDWMHTYDNGIVEEVLIKFGMDNLEFLVALEKALNTIDDLSNLAQLDISLTLHGTKNVTVQLGEGFWADFLTMKMAWTNSNGLTAEFINKAVATEMKVH